MVTLRAALDARRAERAPDGGVRRRRALDQGFVISDHADWTGLLEAIKNTSAANVYVTHGYTDIFARHLNSIGYNASIVETDFQGEDIQAEESEAL